MVDILNMFSLMSVGLFYSFMILQPTSAGKPLPSRAEMPSGEEASKLLRTEISAEISAHGGAQWHPTATRKKDHKGESNIELQKRTMEELKIPEQSALLTLDDASEAARLMRKDNDGASSSLVETRAVVETRTVEAAHLHHHLHLHRAGLFHPEVVSCSDQVEGHRGPRGTQGIETHGQRVAGQLLLRLHSVLGNLGIPFFLTGSTLQGWAAECSPLRESSHVEVAVLRPFFSPSLEDHFIASGAKEGMTVDSFHGRRDSVGRQLTVRFSDIPQALADISVYEADHCFSPPCPFWEPQWNPTGSLEGCRHDNVSLVLAEYLGTTFWVPEAPEKWLTADSCTTIARDAASAPSTKYEHYVDPRKLGSLVQLLQKGAEQKHPKALWELARTREQRWRAADRQSELISLFKSALQWRDARFLGQGHCYVNPPDPSATLVRPAQVEPVLKGLSLAECSQACQKDGVSCVSFEWVTIGSHCRLFREACDQVGWGPDAYSFLSPHASNSSGRDFKIELAIMEGADKLDDALAQFADGPCSMTKAGCTASCRESLVIAFGRATSILGLPAESIFPWLFRFMTRQDPLASDTMVAALRALTACSILSIQVGDPLWPSETKGTLGTSVPDSRRTMDERAVAGTNSLPPPKSWGILNEGHFVIHILILIIVALGLTCLAASAWASGFQRKPESDGGKDGWKTVVEGLVVRKPKAKLPDPIWNGQLRPTTMHFPPVEPDVKNTEQPKAASTGRL